MKSTVEKYFWRGFIDEWSHITLFYQHAFTTDTENQTFLKWLFHKSMIFWIGLLYFVLGCFQYHPWWRLLLSFKTRNHGQAFCRVHAYHCWKVTLESDLLYWLVWVSVSTAWLYAEHLDCYLLVKSCRSIRNVSLYSFYFKSWVFTQG